MRVNFHKGMAASVTAGLTIVLLAAGPTGANAQSPNFGGLLRDESFNHLDNRDDGFRLWRSRAQRGRPDQPTSYKRTGSSGFPPGYQGKIPQPPQRGDEGPPGVQWQKPGRPPGTGTSPPGQSNKPGPHDRDVYPGTGPTHGDRLNPDRDSAPENPRDQARPDSGDDDAGYEPDREIPNDPFPHADQQEVVITGWAGHITFPGTQNRSTIEFRKTDGQWNMFVNGVNQWPPLEELSNSGQVIELRLAFNDQRFVLTSDSLRMSHETGWVIGEGRFQMIG